MLIVKYVINAVFWHFRTLDVYVADAESDIASQLTYAACLRWRFPIVKWNAHNAVPLRFRTLSADVDCAAYTTATPPIAGPVNVNVRHRCSKPLSTAR